MISRSKECVNFCSVAIGSKHGHGMGKSSSRCRTKKNGGKNLSAYQNRNELRLAFLLDILFSDLGY